MKALPRTLVALMGFGFAAGAFVASAAPTIEETVVGPANSGGVFIMSPDGGRIAYVGMKGTRLAVTVDGVEGPVFDELYAGQGQSFATHPQTLVARSTPGGQNADSSAPVIFSPDGAHYAYVGRQGSEYSVIHDGKEVARGPRERLALNYGSLTLSPEGRFVYFMEMDRSGGGNAKWRLVMNGQPGPLSSNNNGINPVFNSNGTRYAYNAASENDTSRQVLVVDGKVANYLGFNPVFTADGKSLLSTSPATATAPKPSVLIDGKPALTALGIDRIIPAPTGSRWGAIVRTKLEGSTQLSAFFLDGKEVPRTEGAQRAWFSRDGKHYAVACQNTAARSMFMVVNGKVHREYPSVGIDDSLVKWTPDGSTFIYTITSGGRPFLIVNEQEVPITMLIGHEKIVMPESGPRYGYGTRDGSNRIHSLIVDGKDVLPEGLRPYDDSLTFSPEGSRYGFFAGPAQRNEMTSLVLDGAVEDGVLPAYFQKGRDSTLSLPSFAFSPNGRHVAYMARSPAVPGNNLFVDGKLVFPTTRGVSFPTFTPDSKHFFWIAEEANKIPGQGILSVVYVDGVETVRANGHFFGTSPGSFTMNKDGKATFFAVDGNVAKRYRITASTDTSVATLLEKGQTIASVMEAAKAEAAKAAADAAAAKAKANEEAAALAARQKAEQEARVAASVKARQEALEARKEARLLQLENAKRKRQGLPPLTELPQSP